LERGQFSSAIQYFEKALRLYGMLEEVFVPYSLLGEAYLGANARPEALKYLELAHRQAVDSRVRLSPPELQRFRRNTQLLTKLLREIGREREIGTIHQEFDSKVR